MSTSQELAAQQERDEARVREMFRQMARNNITADLTDAIKKDEKKVAPAEAPADMPLVVTSVCPGPTMVLVVGAGGTGARVVPPLTQMLRPNDHLIIIDHDIVEDRNLLRQHFSSRDIGSPKAMVLAQRYRKNGITTSAIQDKVTAANSAAMLGQLGVGGLPQPRPQSLIIIGCVDNPAARVGINALLDNLRHSGLPSAAWIDVGNETRVGQVLLTLKNWPGKVAGQYAGGPVNINLPGLQKAMPQLLRSSAADAEESCGMRIDLQSVQVNHLAAAAAINCVSWLLLGIPFTSCGAFFSTLNTMQPIKLARLVGTGVIEPETTYAIAAGE